MKYLIVLISFILSSCNVAEIAGIAETSLDPSVFRSKNIGDICFGPSNSASSPFHSGDGTSGNPYVICNSSQLQSVNNNLSLYYLLDADISLSGFTFTPIGSSATAFSGNFNGGNFQISNLTISSTSSGEPIGLFGRTISPANIKDLSVVGATINHSGGSGGGGADIPTGIFAGTLDTSTTVNNVYVQGNININGGARMVGVFAGRANPGTNISRSSVDGSSSINVTGASTFVSKVGGFIGYANELIISESYSKASINVNSSPTNGIGYTGGFIGEFDSTFGAASITNSYANNSISLSSIGSMNYIGGLLGQGSMDILNSYSVVTFNTGGTLNNFTGGLVGYLRGGTSTNNFAVSNSNSHANTYGFVGSYDLFATPTITSSNNFASGSNCDLLSSLSGCTASTSAATFQNTNSAGPIASWSFPPWSTSSSYPTLNY